MLLPRQFARRGKGSISKVPLHNILTSSIDTKLINRIESVGNSSKKFQATIREKVDTNSNQFHEEGIDLKRLAGVLQKLRAKIRSEDSNRKSMSVESNHIVISTSSVSPKTDVYDNDRYKLYFANVVQNNSYGELVVGNITGLNVDSGGRINQADHAKAIDRATVIHGNSLPSQTILRIIQKGSVLETTNYTFKLIASIVLIIDGDMTTLVDTGLATDVQSRNNILKELFLTGINPRSINFVVTTDGHPEHSGNANEFPESYHFSGKFLHHKTGFSASNLYHEEISRISPNVHLLRTPGHSSDGISVIAANVQNYGTVALTGDLFIMKEDLKASHIWRKISANIDEQVKSRRIVICLADYIIPGHGAIFQVENQLKKHLSCPTQSK